MIKQIIIIFILLGLNGIGFAQTSNVILFTENGEKFTAIINGLRQNDKPETNVKISGLNAEWYKLKLIFDNTALGEKNFNLGAEKGKETTCAIKKNSKGEYVLRLISVVPLNEVISNQPHQLNSDYNHVPNPVQGEVVHSQTTTTTTTHGNPDDVSMNMGIQVGGQGGNININMSGMNGEIVESNSTTTTTVIHSTTTTNNNNNHDPAPPPLIVYLPGYTGKIGCTPPMTPAEFSGMKQTISSKSFEETRLTIAKQVLADRCIFASQVKDLMKLFTFEESMLEIAKFAYDHTYDISNYYKVNDAFTFETSTDELNDYIDSRN